MTEPVDPSPLAAPDTSGVAVLDRAFALLAAFGPGDDRLTLTELSRRTGLYKSTVLRLLGALEHGGFIRKLQDGQYAVGPQPLRLAAIYQRSFHVGHVIEPLLKALSQATGETASFYVRHGEARVAVFRVEPARSVRASVAIGQEYPIAQGASGKVLQAFSSEAGDWAPVRDRLWAVSYGEREPDTASASSPVFAVTGELQGAIALSGPRQRLSSPDTMLAACRGVLKTAGEATRSLGGDAAPYEASIAALAPDLFSDAAS
ncbi:IclR family transcriptional regulator [Paracidovorax anthurii]|uniref:IclR family transcriptional regulator n=1 Tax=Paracidovorax anthurii TaxID=78229 RepID=A0A328Z0X9_9BURK|nr:IclR family transcriptional regulator [Paracidovorax anthurii]RAR79710.1 IclR family transcriptional regulator [Paracidovorax anthurii]WCM94865.1 IclR family transcriptional regulator [Acidovorax sp. NCPPB 2350]